eukprot:5685476-Pyramimonas_sp.AAC.1
MPSSHDDENRKIAAPRAMSQKVFPLGVPRDEVQGVAFPVADIETNGDGSARTAVPKRESVKGTAFAKAALGARDVTNSVEEAAPAWASCASGPASANGR